MYFFVWVEKYEWNAEKRLPSLNWASAEKNMQIQKKSVAKIIETTKQLLTGWVDWQIFGKRFAIDCVPTLPWLNDKQSIYSTDKQ